MSIGKTRNWASVVYPESAPDDWQGLLADTHIPAFISPLHDRDIDDDGVVKKPHFHVVIMADGPITQKRANEIFAPLCGTQSSEYIKSLRGYVRYLAHLDENDLLKAKYDPSEIVALNGADLSDMLRVSVSDKLKIIGEVINYCKDNEIVEFSALTTYAIAERPEWLPVIVERAYFFHQNLASLRHSRKR
jgi:hypothetical protein